MFFPMYVLRCPNGVEALISVVEFNEQNTLYNIKKQPTTHVCFSSFERIVHFGALL